jgi:hypothetical protein
MKNKIIIAKEKYAIVRASKTVEGAFANIIDKNETTVIIEQNKLDKKYVLEVESDYRLISFDMTLPFSLTGFIARISGALAKEKIPIFVVSAFTTDHILIKDEFLEKTIQTLNKLGYSEK